MFNVKIMTLFKHRQWYPFGTVCFTYEKNIFLIQLFFNFILLLLKGACVSERIPGVTYPDGHYVLHSDSKENSILHGELDTAHGPHIFPVRASVLLASRSR